MNFRTYFHVPALNGAALSATSQCNIPVTLVALTVGNWEVRARSNFKRHNFHTKFNLNEFRRFRVETPRTDIFDPKILVLMS
jgi:hypothetical protein